MSKLIYSIAICLMMLSACKSKNKSERVIKFEVMTTSDYCGGAAPDDEILKALKTPQNYTGTLYLNTTPDRITNADIVLDIKDGKASALGLKNTEYLVFRKEFVDVEKLIQEMETDKTKLKEYSQVDLECIRAQNALPLTKFTVTEKTKTVSLTPHLICDPCEPPRP